MKINTKITEGFWYKYEGKVEFKIRIMKMSAIGSSTALGEIMADEFIYCVEDWKGVKDENDKDFECNEENKKFIFDYYAEIRSFVSGILEEQRKKFDIESKN